MMKAGDRDVDLVAHPLELPQALEVHLDVDLLAVRQDALVGAGDMENSASLPVFVDDPLTVLEEVRRPIHRDIEDAGHPLVRGVDSDAIAGVPARVREHGEDVAAELVNIRDLAAMLHEQAHQRLGQQPLLPRDEVRVLLPHLHVADGQLLEGAACAIRQQLDMPRERLAQSWLVRIDVIHHQIVDVVIGLLDVRGLLNLLKIQEFWRYCPFF